MRRRRDRDGVGAGRAAGRSEAHRLRGPELPGTDSGIHEVPEPILREAVPGLLLCARCSEIVTSEDRRIEIDGAHVHRRSNPMGWRFEIGCFSVAPGIDLDAEATTEHSWFVGRTWRVGRCRGCGVQLGWYFEGREPDFHGLILDRLTGG